MVIAFTLIIAADVVVNLSEYFIIPPIIYVYTHLYQPVHTTRHYVTACLTIRTLSVSSTAEYASKYFPFQCANVSWPLHKISGGSSH